MLNAMVVNALVGVVKSGSKEEKISIVISYNILWVKGQQ